MKKDVKNKVNDFFSGFRPSHYKKGQIVIEPNQNLYGAFYLRKGSVKEYGVSPNGIETTIHIFSPHSYFPLMSVINNVQNRYYYEALTPVEIYCAPRANVINFLQENTDVLFELTGRLLRALDKLSLRIEQLANSKASTRLASILIFLARHFGEENKGKVLIKEFFIHKDIASLAGLSRETTSRELKKLAEKGLISNKKRSIVINDLKKLEKEVV